MMNPGFETKLVTSCSKDATSNDSTSYGHRFSDIVGTWCMKCDLLGISFFLLLWVQNISSKHWIIFYVKEKRITHSGRCCCTKTAYDWGGCTPQRTVECFTRHAFFFFFFLMVYTSRLQNFRETGSCSHFHYVCNPQPLSPEYTFTYNYIQCQCTETQKHKLFRPEEFPALRNFIRYKLPALTSAAFAHAP